MAARVNCGKLDLRSLSQDEIISINNQHWLKIDVDEKIYSFQQTPAVVIKFSSMCSATVCDDQQKLNPHLGQVMQNDPSTSQGSSSSTDTTTSLPPSINQNNPAYSGANSAVDMTSLAVFSWFPAAVKPASAVVPMRSNILTYGPYVSDNFGMSAGGTQVDSNTDLAPWVFGSSNLMHQAGEAIAESTVIGLRKSETGSITIPGLPVDTFSNLGIALGGAGPTLSSMSFSFGSGGISTTYQFQTYTPKFGGLSRHIIDRIKDIARNRREQIKFLRNNQITQNKIARKLKVVNNVNKQAAAGGTLQRVMIGEIYNFNKIGDSFTQRTVVGLDTLRDSVREMSYDYDKKAYMSFDGLYSPISKKGDGSLPRYTSFEVGCHKSSSEQASPPFTVASGSSSSSSSAPTVGSLDQYNLEITQKYADPLTNPFEDKEHHQDGEGKGHVIDIVGRKTTVPEKGIITNTYPLDDTEDRYTDDYRMLGMRGPILLHSWGYDLDGKPIPNAADKESDTKSGTFVKEELQDKFLGDWLAKPATWPVAPVDFRFDRKRGVWVSPPGYKVVVAELTQKLEAYGTANARLINKDTEKNKDFGPKLYDKDGKEVKATNEKDSKALIKVVDRLGQKYNIGTKAYCYYDTFKCEYIILQAKPQQSIRFRLIELCTSSAVQPDYGDDWTKYAGYGDKFPNNHILGIRINCDGDAINNKGELISHTDISDEEKKKEIFVNLYDTCGKFGAAYAHYDPNGGTSGYNEWKQKAATGFALICENPSENNCLLGETTSQCSVINPDYDSYDIVFLDSYARFVECTLEQKLYVSNEKASSDYGSDSYKKDNPTGNASAKIVEFYGDSPNGMEPKFYTDKLEEIPFRVFDPFKDSPPERNPFRNLDKDDKVLAIFDENKKKYIIYQALKTDEKIIKFALVDNKDIGDRVSRAVMVDLEGYPISQDGSRLTNSNFSQNFINVFDAFAIHGYSEPNPKYHNFGTTGFGPALGSENFNEHINGIELKCGDQKVPGLPGGSSSNSWKGGPFIGYAVQKKISKEASSTYSGYNVSNEIFFLESFAKFVTGKIASKYGYGSNNADYLGVIYSDNNGPQGYFDGRPPFTRESISQNPKFNLRVQYFIEQHQAGKYITGDLYDEPIDGDVYNSVDGCKFIAKLDHVKSKVNNGSEELYYSIVEVDNIANRGKTAITKKELSDALNAGEITEKADSSTGGIVSEYLDGFMWDKEKSKKNYEKTVIKNRDDWLNKALIMRFGNEQVKHICTNLALYDPQQGIITYIVDHAGTIAQVGEGSLNIGDNSGKFGQPGSLSKTVNNIGNLADPNFYHGIPPIGPNGLENEADRPALKVTNNWMCYDGSKIVALWDETSTPNVEDATYNVIYAREAPVLITGIATSKIRPFDDTGSVSINSQYYPSCPGADKAPVNNLIAQAKNPMGYGAEPNDYVTLQRVFLQTVDNQANYQYIIIGTGKPPE